MPNLKKCLSVWKIIDDIYDVEVVDGLKDDKGIPQKGYCSEEDRLIQIDKPVAECESLDSIKTILHEVAHPVIDSLYRGPIDFDKNEKNMKLLDDTIEFTTSCLIMLMFDNTDQFVEILNLIKRRKEKWQKRTRKPR